jgi:hypothetical protein
MKRKIYSGRSRGERRRESASGAPAEAAVVMGEKVGECGK